MFGQKYESDNRAFCLNITITCKGKKKFRVWAEDYGKKNSKYADREIIVDGKRTVYLSFPVTPRTLFIGVLNAENPQDKDCQIQLMESPLKSYNIWLDEETRAFVKLALHFSQVCGFENATEKGRLFQTNNEEFTIKYFNVIRDVMTGQAINTPARIGHNTGIIEIAKAKFDAYTIPMRMAILLHEFSHKYKNPKIGLKISDEVGADINALYIYLGLGFSKIDAIVVFSKVFLKAQSNGNMNRIRRINEYIQKFENQEYAQLK